MTSLIYILSVGSFTVSVAGKALSNVISLEDRYTGLTLGLLGNNNGDPSDDLQPNNNNAPVPVGSTDEVIFNDFGETCEPKFDLLKRH